MSERTELVRAHRAIDAEDQAIEGVLIMLEVGGRETLLIRLGADGGIHRMGSGSIERIERDRFIGTTDSEVFRGLVSKITPELLSWCGQSRCHPSPRGELCELVIAFKTASGEERTTFWRYGSHSKWPPDEILDFVTEAVRATDSWYQEQKKQIHHRTRRAEYEWWQFFGLPPT